MRNNPTLTVKALRDFFIAQNSSELIRAYEGLSEAVPGPVPTPQDWEAVEYAYNRLFVGPKTVVAPPFASIYIQDEPFIMGETTLEVRRLYQMVGLVSPWEGTLPEDHLSLELDACLYIQAGLVHSGSEKLFSLYRYFLDEHMARWIPLFVARVYEASRVPEAIHWTCRELEKWLRGESEWVGSQPYLGQETLKQRKES
jgi:TorA maturation chaperone TorD